MLDRQIHFPVAQLRIMLDPVLGALHRQRANAGSLAPFRHFVFAERQRPGLDPAVEFLLMLQAVRSPWRISSTSPRRDAPITSPAAAIPSSEWQTITHQSL